MLEPLNGEQLQFLVGLHLRRDGLTRTLPHLNFQRAGVSCPTTRGIRLEEIRDRRQRLGLPVQLVERIRAPVECRVGARSLGRDQRGEALDRLWPLRALDRLLTLLVEIVKTVARLLGALAFAFGALALSLSALRLSLLARSRLLLEKGGCPVAASIEKHGRLTRRNDRRTGKRKNHRRRREPSSRHHRLHYHARSLISLATTRTRKTRSCSSIRCGIRFIPSEGSEG